MTRPSHWILISLAVFATVVTATGSWMRVFTAPRVDHWVEQRGMHALRAVERGQPVELFGAVLDRHGYAVAGAEVVVVGGDAKARTDADGRFSLAVRGRRSHQVTVAAEGFAASAPVVAVPGSPAFVVLPDATPWSEDAAQAPNPLVESGSLVESGRSKNASKKWLAGEGWLKDDAGNEVPFGRVSVRETGATVVADQHGRFQIPLPPASNVTLLAIDEDGRVAKSKPFRPSRLAGLVPITDLVVQEGREIRGYVRDQNGRVCDGAIVVASTGAVKRVAVTGRSGQFWIDGLCLDTDYELSVLPHRGMLGSQQRVLLTSDIEQDLFLSTVEDRRFQVVQHDESPVANAHVVAHRGTLVAYGQANGEGWVTLPGVAPAGLTGATGLEFDVRDESLTERAVERVEGETITVGE